MTPSNTAKSRPGGGFPGPERERHDSILRPVRRVQLFFPPMVFPKLQSRQTAMFPLGLGYIAAVLECEGYEVSLVDCPSEGNETMVDIGKDRYVYGLTREQIRLKIETFRPDAVGISCLFTSLVNQMLMVAEVAKEVDSEIAVICGGPHVSAMYKRLIMNPLIDYCVIGEGEQVTVDLLNAMTRGSGLEDVGALCYRRGGRPVVQPRRSWIENLDEIPFPARHLGNMQHYFEIGYVQGIRLDGGKRLRIVQITSSRGCPFQCTYCAKGVTWANRFRTRSPKNVLDEIEHLIDTYGAERIAFQDDNLTANLDRAAAIFDGIVERKLDITWEAHNGLALKYVTAELLEKMKASGCVSFTIAVESANPATLQRIKKPDYTRLAPVVVERARKLDIEVRAFYMIGFPGETLDDVYRTVEYARGLNLPVSNFAIVTPLPGTELYEECVQKGLIDGDTMDFEDFSFGGMDLQLSEVPVSKLKEIRKIEWLKLVLMDEHGHLRRDTNMGHQDLMDELGNGITLFPDNEDLRRLYAEASVICGREEVPSE